MPVKSVEKGMENTGEGRWEGEEEGEEGEIDLLLQSEPTEGKTTCSLMK